MLLVKKIKAKYLKTLKKIRVWKIRKEYFGKHSISSKRAIVFFVPNEVNEIGGGVLSISTLYKLVREVDSIHKCSVFLSFLPHIKSLDYKYSKFENEDVIFNFRDIMSKNPNLDYLEVHIPDYMLPFFRLDNQLLKNFFQFISNINDLKINILNQNDLLIPEISFIDELKKITKNISMTVAHEKYATLERRNYYQLPLHLFSPWLSPTPYYDKKFSDKENIIIFSPDGIDRVPSDTKITKEQIYNKIKQALPDFEIVTIQNMSYEDYKKIISRAKFTITFGEGLDGYFVESILSGSVSFAVYNEIFFTPVFKELPTVYSSFDILLDKVIDDILKYNSNNELYKNYNYELKMIINSIYSYNRLQKNIKDYYLGNIDFK